MTITPLRSVLLMTALAVPSASSGDVPGMVEDLATQGDVLSQEVLDLDGDGEMEGFVAWSDGCETSVGCRWVVVDTVSGAADVRFTRFGNDPHAGEDALGRPAVISDGVPWRLGRSMMVPGESDYPENLWERASPGDLDLLSATTEFDDPDVMRVMVTTFDLDMDGSSERIMSIEGMHHAMMGGAYTPYTIHDASGDLLHVGYSADGPRIYPHGSGATVVEVSPGGINVKRLE